MVMVNIDSATGIRSIRLEEQASTPSTPPSGFANVFVDGTPLAIAGLQHALDKIDELEAKVRDLERRLVRLEVKA